MQRLLLNSKSFSRKIWINFCLPQSLHLMPLQMFDPSLSIISRTCALMHSVHKKCYSGIFFHLKTTNNNNNEICSDPQLEATRPPLKNRLLLFITSRPLCLFTASFLLMHLLTHKWIYHTYIYNVYTSICQIVYFFFLQVGMLSWDASWDKSSHQNFDITVSDKWQHITR